MTPGAALQPGLDVRQEEQALAMRPMRLQAVQITLANRPFDGRAAEAGLVDELSDRKGMLTVRPLGGGRGWHGLLVPRHRPHTRTPAIRGR